MKQLRPAVFLIPLLLVALALAGLTWKDRQTQQELAELYTPSEVWQSADPNELFSPEIIGGFQNEDMTVITIRQKTTVPMQTNAQTLYLRAGNAARSAAYFPATSSTDTVYSYAAFDGTSLEDALAAQMEYGTAEAGYLRTDEKAQEWEVDYTQEDIVISGRLPTDAFVEQPLAPQFNILFMQGEQVVFADVLNEEIEVGSPVRFEYRLPFVLPEFDRIIVRTM
ncbi:hypothetical protein [Faecalibaculum rodentium]|jgi:hypothetical protein|uniref:hypothetical protein n=3 Tax=Faecalibaculum rodentium TaxID=1702221 RepID=UPI0024907D92|nr:hypothetical protein [Faecalibaculum rodentium]